MAEEHEHSHERKNDKTTFYVAAIAVIVALAAVGYAAMQGDAFNKRIAESEQKQAAALAKLDALDAFAAKLDAFEKQLNVRLADLSVDLVVYYDSDCEFCNNTKLFGVLDGIEPELKNQGITLKRVDVRGDYEATLAKGIDRVPAFYASAEHLRKEPAGKYLQNAMDEWAAAGFDAYNAQGGVALAPRVNSEMLTEPCLNVTTPIQYFYSETCEYCTRVKNNESAVVNPPSDERFKNVAGESIDKLEASFGNSAKVTKHCLGVHSRAENRIALGVNQSDGELCVAAQGEEKTGADQLLAAKYHVTTAPMFVVNCRYVFNAVTEEGIKKWVCAAKPSLPICKALPQATGIPSALASPAN